MIYKIIDFIYTSDNTLKLVRNSTSSQKIVEMR